MKRFLLLGAALSGVVLTGCVAGNGSATVRFGPPPSPRYGVMGYAPGPGFVWTEGYWDWRGGRCPGMCVPRSRRSNRLAGARKTKRRRPRRMLVLMLVRLLRPRDKHGHADTTHHHHQEKRRPWRSSRRRLEGRLCGLRHGHDGTVHRVVADEQQQQADADCY